MSLALLLANACAATGSDTGPRAPVWVTAGAGATELGPAAGMSFNYAPGSFLVTGRALYAREIDICLRGNA